MKYIRIMICLIFAAMMAEAQKSVAEFNAEYSGEEYDFTVYENEKNGDSWYDGGQRVIVTASSALADRVKNKYAASNAHDSKLDTAWVEGKKDYGIGESITFTFDRKSLDKDEYTVRGFSMANGYVKTKKLWGDNSRIKKMKVFADGKAVAIVKLADVYGFQIVRIPEISLSRKRDTAIRLEILEIYPGSRFNDTSLSEVEFFGGGIY